MSMTNEEIQARNDEAMNFAEKVTQLAATQRVAMDTAGIAFIHLAAAAIGQIFDEAAANDFYRMMTDFVASHQRSPEEKRFWNLMAEKGYDKPVAFPKRKAKATRRDA
jgi:hypothetical protein